MLVNCLKDLEQYEINDMIGENLMLRISIIILALMCSIVSLSVKATAGRSNVITKDNLHGNLLYLKNNKVWKYDPVRGNHKQLTTIGKISNYSVSYDANKIAYVTDKKLFIHDIQTEQTKLLTTVTTDLSSPAISPSNYIIAYISKSEKEFDKTKHLKRKVRHIWTFDLLTNQKTDITKESPYEYTSVKYSPDGKFISFSSTQNRNWNVYVKDIDKNIITKIGEGTNSDWIDNNTLAIGTFDKVSIYNVVNVTKIKEVNLRAMFDPAKFSFSDETNTYYEDMSDNPDIDISVINSISGQVKKIVKDARSPLFVK